jgi:O-antigen/teichoic acid export membrane protein
MDSIARRITVNTAWMTSGSVLQKGIAFAYFAAVAMAFGVEITGKYFFALAYVALFAVAADWGISPVLTREIAKEYQRGRKLIRSGFMLKIAFSLLTSLLLLGIARIAGYTSDTQGLILFATVIMVLDSMHLGLYALLRGVERLQYEAIGLAVGQVVLATTGMVVLILVADLTLNINVQPILRATRDIDLRWLLVPYFFTSITHVGIALGGCAKERIFRKASYDPMRACFGWFIRVATPFSLSGILARIYTYSDTFILSLLAGEFAVGLYSTPFKITFAFQFLPLAFMSALYPAMSAAHAVSAERLERLFTTSVRLLLLVALPISVGIAVLARPIMITLFGAAFEPSVLPLTILVTSVPFVFVNFPCGNLLNATGRQIWNTKILALSTTIGILSNLLLIPTYGATGAAIAAVIGASTLTVANCIAVQRVIPCHTQELRRALFRTALAVGSMGIVVAATGETQLVVRILLGIIVYLAAVVAFRAVTQDDLRQFRLRLVSRSP